MFLRIPTRRLMSNGAMPMAHELVRGKVTLKVNILPRPVGVDYRFLADVLLKDGKQGGLLEIIHDD
mgnify:CR=1 FL=1